MAHTELGLRERLTIEDMLNAKMSVGKIAAEIAIKANLGKLEVDVSKVCLAVAEAGFESIGFADSHMIALSRLDLHRRDPFDRTLVAQSVSEDVPVLTSDSKMTLYAIKTMDSRA